MFLLTNTSNYNIDRMLPLSIWNSGLKKNIDYVKYRLSLHPNTMNIVFITDIHTGCGYGVRFNPYSQTVPIDDKGSKTNRGGNKGSSWYNNRNKINILDRQCIILSKLSKEIKIDLIVLGGDYLGNSSSTSHDGALAGLYELNSSIKKLNNIAPILICKGNHDTNTLANNNRRVTDEEYNELVFNNINNTKNTVYMDNGNYGYHDNKQYKVRVIWLNTADMDISNQTTYITNQNPQHRAYFRQEQLEFLINALTIQESGWTVLLFYHINVFRVADETADNAGEAYDLELRKIIGSFRSKLKGTFVRNSSTDQFDINVSYDFTNNGNNKFLCYFYGHYHSDGISNGEYFVINDQYTESASTYQNSQRFLLTGIRCPALVTNNSFNYEGNATIISEPSADGGGNVNTLSSFDRESCVNLISIDTNNYKIYKTMIGNGLSWDFLSDQNISSPNTGYVYKDVKNIKVTVKNQNSEAIENATVILKFNGCDLSLNTDSNGIANITGLPKDKCDVEVSCDGYITKTQSLSYSATSITITLESNVES